MSVFTDLYDAHLTIGGHDITWREILGNALRAGVGRRRHAPQGVGLAGGHRRQRPAVHGLPLHRHRARPRGSPLLGQAGRQVFFIDRVGLRLVALAAEPAQRRRCAGGRAALGHRPGSGRPTSRSAAVGVAVCYVAFRGHRRRLPGGVVVLPGRRVDLRRLDRGDLRDGPRLGRLLAVLDRGRPGRACRCCCTRTSTRRPCCTASTALFVIWGFVTWLRIARTEVEPIGGAAPRPDEVPA